MYQRTVESAEYSEASKKWLVKVRNASSGKELHNKNVLVVGSGNSGIEIALDLANPGAKTSIIVQSQMVDLAKIMLKYFKLSLVDSLMVMLSKLVYGDLTKYGIRKRTEGPFYMKVQYGKYPVY
uniref:indole-3-pyruvate monooxygenase n=1 Tax=Quercus lobata TaxID=97700 RepID=A0A7N2KRX7_QUELO